MPVNNPIHAETGLTTVPAASSPWGSGQKKGKSPKGPNPSPCSSFSPPVSTVSGRLDHHNDAVSSGKPTPKRVEPGCIPRNRSLPRESPSHGTGTVFHPVRADRGFSTHGNACGQPSATRRNGSTHRVRSKRSEWFPPSCSPHRATMRMRFRPATRRSGPAPKIFRKNAPSTKTVVATTETAPKREENGRKQRL